MPGILRPFLERSSPPTTTEPMISCMCLTSSTLSWMRPSLRKSMSPFFTAAGRSFMVMETASSFPCISLVVRVNVVPLFSNTGSFSNLPMRIFGPGRSAITATGLPVFSAAALIFLITLPCSSKVPWEKLSLATFIPARIIFSSISGESDAGPMVHTSLVLCFRISFMVLPVCEILNLNPSCPMRPEMNSIYYYVNGVYLPTSKN